MFNSCLSHLLKICSRSILCTMSLDDTSAMGFRWQHLLPKVQDDWKWYWCDDHDPLFPRNCQRNVCVVCTHTHRELGEFLSSTNLIRCCSHTLHQVTPHASLEKYALHRMPLNGWANFSNQKRSCSQRPPIIGIWFFQHCCHNSRDRINSCVPSALQIWCLGNLKWHHAIDLNKKNRCPTKKNTFESVSVPFASCIFQRWGSSFTRVKFTRPWKFSNFVSRFTLAMLHADSGNQQKSEKKYTLEISGMKLFFYLKQYSAKAFIAHPWPSLF